MSSYSTRMLTVVARYQISIERPMGLPNANSGGANSRCRIKDFGFVGGVSKKKANFISTYACRISRNNHLYKSPLLNMQRCSIWLLSLRGTGLIQGTHCTFILQYFIVC